jgi:hypothetical protein
MTSVILDNIYLAKGGAYTFFSAQPIANRFRTMASCWLFSVGSQIADSFWCIYQKSLNPSFLNFLTKCRHGHQIPHSTTTKTGRDCWMYHVPPVTDILLCTRLCVGIFKSYAALAAIRTFRCKKHPTLTGFTSHISAARCSQYRHSWP